MQAEESTWTHSRENAQCWLCSDSLSAGPGDPLLPFGNMKVSDKIQCDPFCMVTVEIPVAHLSLGHLAFQSYVLTHGHLVGWAGGLGCHSVQLSPEAHLLSMLVGWSLSFHHKLAHTLGQTHWWDVCSLIIRNPCKVGQLVHSTTTVSLLPEAAPSPCVKELSFPQLVRIHWKRWPLLFFLIIW